MTDQRAASLAGLAATATSSTISVLVGEHVEEDTASRCLIAVCGPAGSAHPQAAVAGVEHRWELHRERARTVPPIHPQPKRPIIDSVHRDITKGLL
ncbi:hypothetical protein BBK14_32335 [Parafrankia soli]|uniref:Uncharacterized protein n=1 Tax=Parafrankia soli TaxID=2599596 RepID=A0A1S1R4M1_9ACTN|nr:hypothetical protein [Parafrankia soli]OHV40867.1 hypothetical protein BBK14_32335 [Parafrankia soli]